MATTRPWEDTLDRSEYRAGDEARWKQVDPSGTIERAGYWLSCACEQLGWYYGGVYTGHSLKRTSDGWLLVMRMTLGDHKVVSFTGDATPVDCIRSFAWQVRDNRVTWKPDLY